MLIHKEGRKTLLLTTIILVLLNGLMFRFFPESLLTFILLFVSVVVYALMLNFFKKPSRVYEGDLLGYVNAPADGKIVVIEKTFEKDFFNEERIQISIFMSFFNAHSNWIPVTGKVVHYSHQEGNFHAAFLPKSSHENERSNIIIETPDGHRVLTRQIAGAVARRIVTYVREGEFYHIGDRLGFIKLGSRMDLFLPLDSEILVQIGDEVRANESLLARLPQREESHEKRDS
ncbi:MULTISPECIES: phosphatidylserine decarboxylase family protein [Petrimonas]|jgi:phosphatidylserine decarboxylase|uniref:phosphatidylserine decarboxylase family protein n=1 Tax=Petrimonas TaxID=307628 RepID=UPI001773542D|nr:MULTISPECIES: phosphatidylserine decarboxylase family protein [Petrimonas]MDD3560328.1 phosphatidylserine decarboxylase family protein [Petrimonas mucosa]HHT30600.1 phosphatidylserine decarboxylase family protein [Petrimonas mucosa]